MGEVVTVDAPPIIQTIEIDCEPMGPRPDDYIADIIKGTGLKTKEPIQMFMGEYTWDYSDVDPEKWKKIRPTLKERIKKLYDSGAIRYGSW